jgi:hypothetical protein
MPRKPDVKKADPGKIKAGNFIWSTTMRQPAKVLRVSTVLHLDNGIDEVYREADQVQVLVPQPKENQND